MHQGKTIACLWKYDGGSLLAQFDDGCVIAITVSDDNDADVTRTRWGTGAHPEPFLCASSDLAEMFKEAHGWKFQPATSLFQEMDADGLEYTEESLCGFVKRNLPNRGDVFYVSWL